MSTIKDMFAFIAIFLSLVSYVYFGNPLTARKAYVVSSYLQTGINYSVYFWTLATQLNSIAWMSIGRIEEFLLLPENKAAVELFAKQKLSKSTKEEETLMSPVDNRKSMNPSGCEWGSDIVFLRRRIVQTQMENNHSPKLEFRDATAAWMRHIDIGLDVGIRNVDLDVELGKLCAVVGSVGSGKTSLLQVVLGELDLDDGSVLVAGVVSYAAQEPWLFDGTVRQNIVFVEPWDEDRFVNDDYIIMR